MNRNSEPKSDDLERMEARLAAALYRHACPSPDQLGEYYLGLLNRRQTARIGRHLRSLRCPYCAYELAQLGSFLGELAPESRPSPAESVVGRIRVVVARLVSGVRDSLQAPLPALAPALAGVRGGKPRASVYGAGDVQVSVGTEPGTGAPDRLDLLGLVTGIDPAGSSAHLWQGDQLITTVPLDEGGNFVAPDLAPGSYKLLINGPGQQITYIEELPI